MMSWNERIDAAEKRRCFTAYDRMDAHSWVTCACGMQDPRIPRCPGGWPEDSTLFSLGCRFSDDISWDAFKDARKTLALIEKRAAEILKEVLA